jgi:F-type H+-transporting ATPase subunit epsilon
MQVELVSPERILFSGEAEMVILRAAGGDIAFLENHAPFLGAVDIGVVRIIRGGQTDEYAAVHGGFVEVRDNRVIILSDVAEVKSQSDVERARAAKARAEDELRAPGEPNEEAAKALRRAEVRLEVADAA